MRVAPLVVGLFLLIHHLLDPCLNRLPATGRAVIAFLLIGTLASLGRYLAARPPVVFVQDVLAELVIYAAAGLGCGVALTHLAAHWAVRASPAWPAVAAYLALTIFFDRRDRPTPLP